MKKLSLFLFALSALLPLSLAAETASVTFNVKDADGAVLASKTLSYDVGTQLSELPAELVRPYTTYDFTSYTVTAGDNVVDVRATFDLPFQVSTEGHEVYYYLKTSDTKAMQLYGDYLYEQNAGTADAFKFAFFGNPYALGVFSKSGQKWVYPNSAYYNYLQTTADRFDWELAEGTNGGFQFQCSVGKLTTYSGYFYATASAKGINITAVLAETSAPKTEVRVNVYDADHNLLDSKIVKADIGATLTDVPAEARRDFCTYTVTPIKVEEGKENVLEAVASWTLPFEVSDESKPVLYYLTSGDSVCVQPRYLESYNAKLLATTSLSADAYKSQAACMWFIHGDPYAGFSFENAAGGFFSANHETQYAVIADAPELWQVSGSPESGYVLLDEQGYSVLVYTGYCFWGNYANYYDCSFKLQAVPAEIADTIHVGQNYPALVAQRLVPYLTEAVDSYYGLTTEGVNALKSRIEAAAEACDKATFEELSAELEKYIKLPEEGKYYRLRFNSDPHYLSLGYGSAMGGGTPPTPPDGEGPGPDGQGGQPGGDGQGQGGQPGGEGGQGGGPGPGGEGGPGGGMPPGAGTGKLAFRISETAEAAKSSASSVYHLVATADGGFTLSTQGYYLGAGVDGDSIQAAEEPATLYFERMAPGRFSVRSGNTSDSYYALSTDSVLVASYYTGDAATLVIEEVTSLTFPLYQAADKSYRTLYLPFAVSLSEEVKAYVVNVVDNQAELTEWVSRNLPANYPVLLVSDTNASEFEATIEPALLSGEEELPTLANALEGIFIVQSQMGGGMTPPDGQGGGTPPDGQQPTDGQQQGGGDGQTPPDGGNPGEGGPEGQPGMSNGFYLNMQNGVVGFYSSPELQLPDNNQAFLPFSEEYGDITVLPLAGLDGIVHQTTNATSRIIYDLQGRRITRPQHGVYIENGRKVLR